MKILWHISTIETQHNSFKSGHLINKWAGAHPEIFDEDDLRLAFFKNLKNITVKEVRLVTIDKQSTVR